MRLEARSWDFTGRREDQNPRLPNATQLALFFFEGFFFERSVLTVTAWVLARAFFLA